MDPSLPDARTEESGARSARVRLTIGASVVLVLLAVVVAVVLLAASPRGSVRTATAPTGVVASGSPGGQPTPATSVPRGRAPSIFVHLVGAVRHPGLYELREGARAVDAVAAAGGFSAAADRAQLNLARPVSDGEQIVIPKVGAPLAAQGPGSSPGSAAGGSGVSGKVNLNTADASALETLAGVGPALAKRILDWRTAHGRFSTPEDLLNVPGFGDKKFAAIKDSVTT